MWTCTANLRTEELTYHRPSSAGKESSCIVGDPNLIPGSGRDPGEGNGNPLQYSCLQNSMGRGILLIILWFHYDNNAEGTSVYQKPVVNIIPCDETLKTFP